MNQGQMMPGQQPQQGLNIDPNLCPQILCTFCDCETFMKIERLKAVPVLMMPPNGGHINLSTIHCTNCQKELDLERAKKWAGLSKEERQQARFQMQTAEAEKAAKGVLPNVKTPE